MAMLDDSTGKSLGPSESNSPQSKRSGQVVPGPAPEIAEILEDLPEDQRSAVRQIIQATSHSGWLPPPSVLAEYNSVVPGLAERIIRMPEREQEHRHRVVEGHAQEDTRLKRRGQLFALASVVMLLSLAALLAFLGEPAWAGRIAIFGLVGVVGIFITGQWAEFKMAKLQSEDATVDDEEQSE